MRSVGVDMRWARGLGGEAVGARRRPRTGGGAVSWLTAALLSGCVDPKAEAPDGPAAGEAEAGDGADEGGGAADGGAPNRPPSAPEIELAPAAPRTSEDLVVVVVSASVDPEGAAVRTRYAWSQNGVLRADLTESVVPSSETSRGERWEVAVTASDGLADSATARAVVTVANSPPSAPLFSVSPSLPSTTEDLRATMGAPSVDPDGDAVTYRYAWSQNGALRDDQTGPVVPAAETARGERWEVSVVASDGSSESAPARAATTVANAAPTMSALSLSPATVFTNDTITASVAGSDADGDPLSFRTVWTVNGLRVGPSALELSGALYFDKGDVVQVTVTPQDGTASGAAWVSSPLTVQDSAPVVRALAFSPATLFTNDTITALVVARDADGDAVGLSYAWTVNGVSRGGDSPTLQGTTEFDKGDVVQVTVTPHDGAASGAAAVSSPLTVQNSPPTVDAVTMSHATVRTDDTVTASVRVSDPDGDAVDVGYAWTVNGLSRGGDSPSLSGILHFSRGDRLRLVVTPTDGAASGAGFGVPEYVVANSPPSTPTVSFSPAEPAAGLTLRCQGWATDPDGDSVRYVYRWQVDGVAHPERDPVLSPGETAEGEVWRCEAIAVDGGSGLSLVSGPGYASVTVGPPTCGGGEVTLLASAMQFVSVCGETVDMGCTPGQSSCDSDESPVRATTLTRDYYMAAGEVTRWQFSRAMGYDPSIGPLGDPFYYWEDDMPRPVEHLSWHEAAAFANAVSAASGLAACYACSGSGPAVSCAPPADPYACVGYRLPTEAEWEAAARCGDDLLYAGSDVISEVAWYGSVFGGATTVGGLLAPNACGLYDLSGSVWEWTNDWYLSTAYGGGGVIDPAGPATGAERVVRGGGWADDPLSARVASRSSWPVDHRDGALGLRIVRTAP